MLSDNSSAFTINYKPKHVDSKCDFKLDDIILNQVNNQTQIAEIDDEFDIIICNSDLNHCLLAFIDDSFTSTKDKIVC